MQRSKRLATKSYGTGPAKSNGTGLAGGVAVLILCSVFPATVYSLEVEVSDKPLSPSSGGEYVGGAVCQDCHPDHYRKWFLSSHAKAYKSLKTGSQKTDPVCLRCHTTGFTGTFNPNLAGVQCEACHGPSSAHASTAKGSSPSPTPSFPPDCKSCEVIKICMPCHNQKQSPDFDFNSYYQRIRH